MSELNNNNTTTEQPVEEKKKNKKPNKTLLFVSIATFVLSIVSIVITHYLFFTTRGIQFIATFIALTIASFSLVIISIILLNIVSYKNKLKGRYILFILYYIGLFLALATTVFYSVILNYQSEQMETYKQYAIGGDIVAPTIVDINTVNGQTVDIVIGGFVDINVGEDYTAVVSDPTVAEYSSAVYENDTYFSAGLLGLKAGSTKVELTNITTGVKTTFTVVVNILYLN